MDTQPSVRPSNKHVWLVKGSPSTCDKKYINDVCGNELAARIDPNTDD